MNRTFNRTRKGNLCGNQQSRPYRAALIYTPASTDSLESDVFSFTKIYTSEGLGIEPSMSRFYGYLVF